MPTIQERDQARERILIGYRGAISGKYQYVAYRHYTNRGRVFYWTKKVLNPKWHCMHHGGHQNPRIWPSEEKDLNQNILRYLKADPEANLTKVTNFVSTYLRRHISKVLKKLGWSWRIPCHFQIMKYTMLNMAKYLDYISSVKNLDITKIKFLDESHIISRKLHQKYVLGLVNKKTFIKKNDLHEPSGSLTILTSIIKKPIVFSYRLDSNTQWDFYQFIHFCCTHGYLVKDDYLILDNARVHVASESFLLVKALLLVYEVKLIYLPAYSPELNACELVFNVMKHHLRNSRTPNTPILTDITKSLATIDKEMMKKFYVKCIFPKIILPEILI